MKDDPPYYNAGMAGVERILEYADNNECPSEPTSGLPAPTKAWPATGRIVTRDLCVRYRPELPLALKDVSCTIEPCAKVGIVAPRVEGAAGRLGHCRMRPDARPRARARL